ncbi:hypothetical protein L9F63_005352, partial [Diploptera punctata]
TYVFVRHCDGLSVGKNHSNMQTLHFDVKNKINFLSLILLFAIKAYITRFLNLISD